MSMRTYDEILAVCNDLMEKVDAAKVQASKVSAIGRTKYDLAIWEAEAAMNALEWALNAHDDAPKMVVEG